PGGGTAAAVALSQGAALSIMVCNLTLGKERWQDGWNIAESCIGVAEPLLERGHQLASEDAEAFDQVMTAFRLPKSNDDEISLRKSAIQDGTLNAAMVPLETARMAYELLHILPDLASYGNANAVTDVGVAGLLVSAACKGALFNVEININSLPDNLAVSYRDEMESLRIQCRDKAREVMHCVHERMQS
ncbi:MAG: cyclodeaminase/cyclohydrolase family protein, partial [Candidatus Thalassarchaeaceae archaeon]|nr:cyclodeaminase/cyclohydrolase family protein [Candidatus Thalassarchaeaceae archaeon]